MMRRPSHVIALIGLVGIARRNDAQTVETVRPLARNSCLKSFARPADSPRRLT